MDSSKDYYSTLGVMPTAEDIVIHGAYRALAQRYHPDRFEGSEEEANDRMTEINEAYEVLSDEARRAEYDRERDSGESLVGDGAYVVDSRPQKPPAPFEVEAYRSFAEKLRSWNYGEAEIRSVLVARGVKQNVAEYLARMVSNEI